MENEEIKTEEGIEEVLMEAGTEETVEAPAESVEETA